MLSSPGRILLLALVALSLVPDRATVVAFDDLLDDILSYFYDSESESDSVEVISANNKNVSIVVKCENCTVSLTCDKCAGMTMPEKPPMKTPMPETPMPTAATTTPLPGASSGGSTLPGSGTATPAASTTNMNGEGNTVNEESTTMSMGTGNSNSPPTN